MSDLVVVHLVESFAGGVLHFLETLIKGQRKLYPDMRFWIIHGMRNDTPADFKAGFPEDVQFVHWKSSRREIGYRDALAFYEALRILKDLKRKHERFILHLHSSKAGFIGRLVAKILRISDTTIYTPHAAPFLQENEPLLKRELFLFLERLGARMGGIVIANSKSERDVYRRYGIEADFIPNGVDLRELREVKPLPLRKGKPIVGTAGRVAYQKGPDIFAEISLALKGEAQFLWIGDGPMREVLEKAGVKVTGWLPRREALRYIASLDVYLSTSRWEGMPLAVLQAMGLGKPLILSNCVGNVDLVDGNGFLFKETEEAVESLRKLLGEEELHKAFSKASFENSKKYSMENLARNYFNLYKRLFYG